MHDEMDFLILYLIYEQAMRDKEENLNNLLIMDDVTASLKNRDVQMLVKKLNYNRRHYPLSIICLVQWYTTPRDPQDDKPFRLLQTPGTRRR